MVVVCGEALIDIVPDRGGTQRTRPGGGPYNTARALARLGVSTAFLGHLSNDAYGGELAELLVADGARLALATVGSEPTTSAIAHVDADGLAEYEFRIDGTSAPNLTPAMLPEQLAADVDALHVGTLGLVLEPMASTLVELVRRERRARLVMVDPNVRPGLIPDDVYRQRLHEVISSSTIVKASDSDLAWLYPGLDQGAAADRLLASGVRLVVVTLGERGAFGAQRGTRVAVEAVKVDVVDTIGAGDAFGAALLAWLHDHGRISLELTLEPEELRSALGYACLAAAIACTRSGAEPPYRSELS